MCAVVSEGQSLEVEFLSHSSVSCCLMAFYRGCADFHSLKKSLFIHKPYKVYDFLPVW